MIRFLPFIVVAILVLGGLMFWRFIASKPNLATSQTPQESSVEVPKTLPQATIEDRVKALEEVVTKLVTQVNVLKPASSQDAKISTLESTITELKVRVSALEKATPAPAPASGQSTVYIPIGAGGGPWGNQGWYSLSEYQISLDPANYPGYTGMVLEVNFRLTAKNGTGSVRLYNTTDNTAMSSQVDTTSDTYGVYTSSSFKLPTGNKNYILQMKSSNGQDLAVQSARIKVNF